MSDARDRGPAVLASGPMPRVATKSPPTLRPPLRRAGRAVVGAALLAAAALIGAAPARAVELPAHLRVEPVVAEANFPVALAWTPDGRLFYTEKSGALRVVENGQLRDEPFAVFEVDDLFERGLIGVAVDPDFASNGFVYVYYTRADTAGHRVVRLREVDGRGVEPTILLDEPNPTGFAFHNGGNLHFGPDGYLYLTLGENSDPSLAPRLDTPLGKILRLDAADGGAPSDNPFYDDGDPASGNDDRIWALGLRNSFDFTFHPSTGEIFATENGPECDDEVNRIERGADYGWGPLVLCNDPHLGFTAPLWRFGDTIAPTGIAFHRGGLFMCAWNTGALMRFEATDPSYRELTAVESWDGVPCQIDVAPGPDGALYVTDARSISRIVFPDAPPEFTVPGGRFYTQAGSGRGGFAIVDDAEAAFWTAYQNFGGVEALGYPASQRFELNGFLYQATQASLLQRHPATGEVRLANVFDMLGAAGFDAWLDAYRQIPLSREWLGDRGLAWPDIRDRHLAILEPYPPLLARFRAVPDWINRYGLPMGVHELDSVVVVRGQRAAFQLWKVDVPWAKPGAVTIVLAGDLAKEAGLVPTEAQMPEPIPFGQ